MYNGLVIIFAGLVEINWVVFFLELHCDKHTFSKKKLL